MTRRRFLALTAGFLLSPALAFCDGLHAAGAPLLTVAVATDLHYLAPSLTDNGPFFTRLIEEGDGKAMRYIEPLVDAFCEQIARERPDALILSGDLAFNGERESHEQLVRRLARVQAAGVRVLALPGNHDLNMRIAARFEGDGYALVPSVTADEFAALYADFGYADALSRDDASLSYVFALTPELRLLFLDVNGVSAPGSVPESTLLWAREQLERAKADGARVVAVSHQNLSRHNEMIYRGFTIDNAEALLALYREMGVPLNLSGHIHMQHIARGRVPDIATSSLAVSPNQYGVLRVYADRLEYETRTVDVSAFAVAHGMDDPNLLDFPAYAARFFRETALRQALSSVKDDPDPEALARYMADVNAAVFAGRTDLIAWDDALLARWKAQSPFNGYYLDSLQKSCHDDTRLTVPL